MDRLEQYIKDNVGRFDTELPPPGSRERFVASLQQQKKENSARKSRKLSWRMILMASSAAAALVAVVAGLSFHAPDRAIVKSISAMNSQEAQVIALVADVCPEEMDAVMNSIRSITAEAIPLPDLLPDELPVGEKIRIVKEYYGRKTEALQSLMACFCESME